MQKLEKKDFPICQQLTTDFTGKAAFPHTKLRRT